MKFSGQSGCEQGHTAAAIVMVRSLPPEQLPLPDLAVQAGTADGSLWQLPLCPGQLAAGGTGRNILYRSTAAAGASDLVVPATPLLRSSTPAALCLQSSSFHQTTLPHTCALAGPTATYGMHGGRRPGPCGWWRERRPAAPPDTDPVFMLKPSTKDAFAAKAGARGG